jgi:hypothetical protein
MGLSTEGPDELAPAPLSTEEPDELAPAPPPVASRAALPELDQVDRAMLAFAAQHRFTVTEQLAAVGGIGPEGTRRRVRRLVGDGLLTSRRHLHDHPAAHQITRSGLRAVDSDLPATARINLSLYHHDLGLGWLMVLAHRGRFGRVSQVIGEREMRSRDGRIDPGDDPVGTRRLGILLPGEGPRGGPRVHYPDLLLVTPAARHVAIELELSTKSPARRERILKAYLLAPRVDAVLYLVPNRAAGRAIARSAARVGASDLVHVQRIRFADRAGPGARQRVRQLARAPARAGRSGPPAGRSEGARREAEVGRPGASGRAPEAGRTGASGRAPEVGRPGASGRAPEAGR